MNPEQALNALTDTLDRHHRERQQRRDRGMSDTHDQLYASYEEVARLRAENSAMLAALQAITGLCKREPANPFLADDLDRLAIAAITTATTGETS